MLCHQEQHADAREYLLAQRQLTRTPEGVTNRALGPLLLVRVSAISNAWVHMQCALWSGEVRLHSLHSDLHILNDGLVRVTRTLACAQ